MKILGKPFAVALEKAGIVVNYNAIPNDPQPPMNPSGVRLGTPALTVRGMGKPQMKKIAAFMYEVSKNLENKEKLREIAKEVKDLCKKFPIDLA
jgi:glycine hydroxymethyltransferase